MQLDLRNFQSLEVDLQDQILDILSRQSSIQPFNVQLNLFGVRNSLLCFCLLLSKKFHFERVHFLDTPTHISNMAISLVGFWQDQGLEFQTASNLYEFPSEFLTNSLNIIEYVDQSPETLKKIFDQLPKASPIILFKKNLNKHTAEDIWTFMHPFWNYFDIKTYRELMSFEVSAFILYGQKR